MSVAVIPLYVIVDQERDNGPRDLQGYRRTPTGYELILLDAHGRLLLAPLGLYLALRDDQVVCYDAATGAAVSPHAARPAPAEVSPQGGVVPEVGARGDAVGRLLERRS